MTLSGIGAGVDRAPRHPIRSVVSTGQYLTMSRFWFESFQNWQSEFLAVAAIVLASVYLRERGSAESKPVAAPHRETGA